MSRCSTAYSSSSRCLWLALSVVWAAGTATATWADQKFSLWSHNGSVLYLVANGTWREFHYKQPRPGMVQVGAYPDALLFRGQSINHEYFGTAFLFNSQCGQLPYQVRGSILDGYKRVLMTGQAPQVGPDCRVIGYFDDTLDFRLIEPAPPNPSPQPSPPPPAALSSVLVPLQRNEGGTFVVPVVINGVIPLKFVVDTGAADVSIPVDVLTEFRNAIGSEQ